MNPLNKTAGITPNARPEKKIKISTTSSPVVIQSSLASRIPTHQGSLVLPRSLSSYSVTPVAVESIETKASSSSSSSPPTRIISSASSSSSSPSPLDKAHQGTQIHQEELMKLLSRSLISEEEKVAVFRELQGRMSEVINAATTTNPAQPELASTALYLLVSLSQGSGVKRAELWATLGAAGRAAVVTAATSTAEPAIAKLALGLLFNLSQDSGVKRAELWATLGAAGRAAVVTAATSTAEPAVAKIALGLLFNLSLDSGVKRAELWTTLGAAGLAAVVTAATNSAEPAIAKLALGLLVNLSLDSGVKRAELWATLGAAGRAAVVTAATSSAEPAMARIAMSLLINLINDSDGRRSELWATLRAAGLAAVVNTATSSAEPALAMKAMRLLASLSNYSDDRTTKSWSFLGALGRATDDRTTKIWSTLGAAGRAAVVTAATNPAQPEVAESALFLLSHLTARTESRAVELWGTLGAQDREGLINAATTVGEPKVVLRALELLNFWQEIPEINAAIWPLLQPRFAQLWAVSQLPNVEQKASRFLFNQIQGNIYRTRQALNALIAVTPTISMRNAIAALRLWGREVSHDLPERLALLTGIVQANTTAQKMAVLTTAVMSGIDIRNHPRDEREALRNQLLAMPLAEGIDPEPYRQRMRLGFDAACGNTSAVLESPVLSAPEKLQLRNYVATAQRKSDLKQVVIEHLASVTLPRHGFERSHIQH